MSPIWQDRCLYIQGFLSEIIVGEIIVKSPYACYGMHDEQHINKDKGKYTANNKQTNTNRQTNIVTANKQLISTTSTTHEEKEQDNLHTRLLNEAKQLHIVL